MRKNILKYGDANGWSYYFIHREQSKYSRHNVLYHAHRNPEPVNLDGIDLVFIHSPDINKFASDELPLIANKKGIPTICSYGGYVKNIYKEGDIMSSISPQTYKLAKRTYPNKTVIFLPESVDCQFFQPKTDYSQFRVGWVGRECEIKRHWLLNDLKYPVQKQCDWGKQYFTKYRTLEPMREYLHNIDVLVLLSKSECQPRVIMEAMACGLPVISTNVGSISMMLDKECIVPSFMEEGEDFFTPTKYPKNEKLLVEAVNEKLDKLANNPKLRALIGTQNRINAQALFSWKSNTKLWDDVFDAVIDRKFDKASELCYTYTKRWENLFE